MLEVESLYIGYDGMEAIKGISFHIGRGEIVCLLGANGAGKSTILRAISGLIHPTSGTILFQETNISDWPPDRIVKLGISHVPEGRQIFPDFNVLEHLQLGAYCYHYNSSKKGDFKKNLDQVFDMFPRLKERQKQLGGTMSGGEQQMLAVGRALMSQPKLLLLDEPTMGVAPILVREILETIREFPKRGVSALIVEQNVRHALRISDRGYVLVDGKIALVGTAKDLLNNRNLVNSYLAGTVEQRKETQ